MTSREPEFEPIDIDKIDNTLGSTNGIIRTDQQIQGTTGLDTDRMDNLYTFDTMDIDPVDAISTNFNSLIVDSMDIDSVVGAKPEQPQRSHWVVDTIPLTNQSGQEDPSTWDRNISTRKRIQVTSLAYKLVGDNPVDLFIKNCTKTLTEWMPLLCITTLPVGITSSDSRIITAFRAIDNIICGQETNLLQRLAYIQLAKLFISVEAIIKSDRDKGLICRAPFYRNASIAMEIYTAAQKGDYMTTHSSNISKGGILRERKRSGRTSDGMI